MAAYRKLLTVSLIIASAYMLIAFETHPRRNQEVFPFFSWSLFSYSGAEREDFTLAIIALDGEALDHPTIATDMMDRLPRLKRDSRFRKIIWRWASAIYLDDSEEEAAMRDIIETRYFAEYDSVRYQLVQTQYEPLKRYRDRSAVEIIREIEEYEFARAEI